MALTRTTTLTTMLDNNRTKKTISKVVELVVVDNKLVPDFRELDPGVICGLQVT